MAIKGQNIRLFLGGKCVALCQQTSFHAAAQLADVSSKDSTGDWQEQKVVGLNWDASVNAYVMPSTETVNVPDLSQMSQVPTSSTMGYYNEPILLAAGDSIEVISSKQAGRVYDKEFNTLAQASASLSRVTYTATQPIEVYVGFGYSTPSQGTVVGIFTVKRDGSLNYDDFMMAIENKTEFEAILTETYGAMNRAYDDDPTTRTCIQGTCIITDVSLDAQNRQLSTYQMQLTGTGDIELLLPEDEDEEEE